MRRAPPLERVIVPDLGDEWPSDGVGHVSVVMDALPDASELPSGAFVGVLSAPPRASVLGIFRRKRFAHVAVRCAALLAKGYADVGAGVDDDGRDVAWGRAPV